jgi:hypothetical protein
MKKTIIILTLSVNVFSFGSDSDEEIIPLNLDNNGHLILSRKYDPVVTSGNHAEIVSMNKQIETHTADHDKKIEPLSTAIQIFGITKLERKVIQENKKQNHDFQLDVTCCDLFYACISNCFSFLSRQSVSKNK